MTSARCPECDGSNIVRVNTNGDEVKIKQTYKVSLKDSFNPEGSGIHFYVDYDETGESVFGIYHVDDKDKSIEFKLNRDDFDILLEMLKNIETNRELSILAQKLNIKIH